MYTQQHLPYQAGSFSSLRPGFFTKFTYSKALFYAILVVYVGLFFVVCGLEAMLPPSLICNPDDYPQWTASHANIQYVNPSYRYDVCQQVRLPFLLYLTKQECSFGRRLLAAVLLGGIVGWERREADRPAGIRTMSLVSLGACLFSINSAFAFLDGPMGWDSSRVSAAIPSGVGFLGAGLIFKQAEKDNNSGDTTHVVHGLTTAASLWISAAVGVACAGELYFSASFSVAVILLLLRFGPRQLSTDDEGGDDEEDNGIDQDFQNNSTRSLEAGVDPERQPLRRPSVRSSRSARARKQASLGGIL